MDAPLPPLGALRGAEPAPRPVGLSCTNCGAGDGRIRLTLQKGAGSPGPAPCPAATNPQTGAGAGGAPTCRGQGTPWWRLGKVNSSPAHAGMPLLLFELQAPEPSPVPWCQPHPEPQGSSSCALCPCPGPHSPTQAAVSPSAPQVVRADPSTPQGREGECWAPAALATFVGSPGVPQAPRSQQRLEPRNHHSPARACAGLTRSCRAMCAGIGELAGTVLRRALGDAWAALAKRAPATARGPLLGQRPALC